MKFIVYLLFVSFSLGVVSEEKTIVFSYWSEAAPPFVILKNVHSDEISGGILNDLAYGIADKLNAIPSFVSIPVQRTESYLQSGAVDLNCITNPIWKEKPDEYYWSPPLFKGADRLLVNKGNGHEIATFDDLRGKILGIYNGYTYDVNVMDMINSGEIETVKLSDIEHGIKLLKLGRIDALIDFDILLNYQIKRSHSEDNLTSAPLLIQTYNLYCAYSKKTKYEKTHLDQVVNDLISNGEIDQMLNSY